LSTVSGIIPNLETQKVHSGPTCRIERSRGWAALKLGEVWHYRELLYFFAWRDIKVRYKQTAIGAGWAVLQPLATMTIFTLIFGRLAKMPSDGLPYSIFAFAGLLPWNYFAQAVSRSGASLVGNAGLISKVYFPRLIVPLSATVAPLVDFVIGFLALTGMMIWFSVVPSWRWLALPLFLIFALHTALAVGLWLAALNVRYRDVAHTIPFLVQFWMFASPVAYPGSLVPEKWRLLYGLNPMAGVIEGFRWCLLGTGSLDARVLAASAATVLVLLWGGAVFFKRMERTFADVV
jgi:homopolymeric O-antigen transport system permease protein